MRPSSLLHSQAATLLVLAAIFLAKPHAFPTPDAARADSPSPAATHTPDPFAQLATLQNAFNKIAQQQADSVVAISAPTTIVDAGLSLRSIDMSIDTLRSILNRSWRTVGSGFVIHPDGYILTSEHVIKQAQQLWVTTDDGKIYPAIVVGSDPRLDIAVIKIPLKNLTPLPFADHNSVQRGLWAITLGNPYGVAAQGQLSISIGVVSALGRSLPDLARKEDRLYVDLIQTTAQISPGNSGGPLLNIHGQVIGINTATLHQDAGTGPIGFAIPITPPLLARIQQLQQGRQAVSAYLGVNSTTPSPSQRQQANLQQPIGAYIDAVSPASPAAEAGLAPGDIILQINDQTVRSSDHLSILANAAPIDIPSSLLIRRGTQDLQIQLTFRKRPSTTPGIWRDTQRLRWRGLLLAQIPTGWNAPASNSPNTPPSGVMVLSIENNSPMFQQGLQPGSIITAVADRPVRDLLEMLDILNEIPTEHCHLQTIAPTTPATAQRNPAPAN